MSEDVNPVRRIVAGEDENGRAVIFSDGPSPDVMIDPARPGFAATRIWATDSPPAKIKGIRESLNMAHGIEPPKLGSVCRYVTYPPEKNFVNGVSETNIRDYFAAIGSPQACTYMPDAPHPYMQKTETLDFCYILDGEITLVLDVEEIDLKAGDTVVQRGTNHAWSNRSDAPCTIIFCQHDAAFGN